MHEGRAAFQGSYKELLSSGLDLTALLPKEEVGAGAEAESGTGAETEAGLMGRGGDADGGGAKVGGAAVVVQAEKKAQGARPCAAGDSKLMDAEARTAVHLQPDARRLQPDARRRQARRLQPDARRLQPDARRSVSSAVWRPRRGGGTSRLRVRCGCASRCCSAC